MMRRIASAVFATALFVFMVSACSVPPPTDNTTAPDIFTANSQTGGDSSHHHPNGCFP